MRELCLTSAPVVGLLGNIVIQILMIRMLPNRALLKSIVGGFIFGIAISLILTHNESLGVISYALLTYFALGYGYFHFVNLGETGRRIRILREFSEHDNELSEESILKLYNAEMLVNTRLGRLLRKGQIVKKDGKFFIGKPMVLTIAKIMDFLGSLLLKKKVQNDTN